MMCDFFDDRREQSRTKRAVTLNQLGRPLNFECPRGKFLASFYSFRFKEVSRYANNLYNLL